MKLKTLHEVGKYSDFADEAEDTLNKIKKLAGAAFQTFKTAKAKADTDIRADAAKAKAALDSSDKDQPQSDATPPAKAKLNFSDPKTAEITVAGIILDRTPEADDLPEFDSADAKEIEQLRSSVEKIFSRFEKFEKELLKAFKNANFISADDKAEVVDRLGDQQDKILDAAETALMQNRHGERDAWMASLLKDDSDLGTRALVKMIADISKKNEIKNLTQSKKYFATGLNLVNLIGGQRQTIGMRISLMRDALEQLSNRPAITEELLKRVGKLAKKL